MVTSDDLRRKREAGKWIRRSTAVATKRKRLLQCAELSAYTSVTNHRLLANIANFDRTSPVSVFQYYGVL